MEETTNNGLAMKDVSFTLITVVIIIVVAVVILLILRRIFSKYRSNTSDVPKEKKTAMRMAYSVLQFVIILIAIIAILQANGVNVTAAVTSMGIATAIGGLAVQDLLKDLIMGMIIAADKFFAIGDVVEYQGFVGKIIEFSMRSTKLQSIYDGSTMTVENHYITQVRKLSHQTDLLIPLAYESDVKEIYRVFGEIEKEVKALNNVENCMFKGIQDFGDSAISYLFRFYSKPSQMPEARRSILRIIQAKLNEAGLVIPYMQVDVHQSLEGKEILKHLDLNHKD